MIHTERNGRLLGCLHAPCHTRLSDKDQTCRRPFAFWRFTIRIWNPGGSADPGPRYHTRESVKSDKFKAWGPKYSFQFVPTQKKVGVRARKTQTREPLPHKRQEMAEYLQLTSAHRPCRSNSEIARSVQFGKSQCTHAKTW